RSRASVPTFSLPWISLVSSTDLGPWPTRADQISRSWLLRPISSTSTRPPETRSIRSSSMPSSRWSVNSWMGRSCGSSLHLPAAGAPVFGCAVLFGCAALVGLFGCAALVGLLGCVVAADDWAAAGIAVARESTVAPASAAAASERVGLDTALLTQGRPVPQPCRGTEHGHVVVAPP